jgi:exopolysaccharide biosynthesis WecB/TagA/CpsF family protein
MPAILSIPVRYKAATLTAPQPANDSYSKIMVGGIATACLSRDELARMMLQDCMSAHTNNQRQPKLVFASNGHTIALAAKDPSFRKILEQADVIHADGQAAVFASRMTDSPIPERSATTDFIHDAAKLAAQHGLRFFLLGTTEETNAEAARMLRAAYPGLQIVGRRHGYFSRDEEKELCDEINLTQPDVIWVGLSAPLEYEFSVRNKARLRAGWLVTCGGCYRFITGACKRAPRWMQAIGLEWLFRVVQEPRRLFWRYAATNPLAIFLLLTRTTSLQTAQ